MTLDFRISGWRESVMNCITTDPTVGIDGRLWTKLFPVLQRSITNFNFLLWLLLDSHVTGTGNSLVQNRPFIPTPDCGIDS